LAKIRTVGFTILAISTSDLDSKLNSLLSLALKVKVPCKRLDPRTGTVPSGFGYKSELVHKVKPFFGLFRSQTMLKQCLVNITGVTFIVGRIFTID